MLTLDAKTSAQFSFNLQRALDFTIGNPIEDKLYGIKDFDRTLVLEQRTKAVAGEITREEIQFSRFVNRLQLRFSQIFMSK